MLTMKHKHRYVCRDRSLAMFSLNMEIKASLPPGVKLHTSHQNLKIVGRGKNTLTRVGKARGFCMEKNIAGVKQNLLILATIKEFVNEIF